MTMTGGDGADTFVINLDDIKGKHNTVTITDFDPSEDKLQLGSDAHVWKSSDHHGGTLLQVGNETIDLVGVRPNELHHHDWIASGGTTKPEGGQGFGWWGQFRDSVISGQTPATATSTGGPASQGSDPACERLDRVVPGKPELCAAEPVSGRQLWPGRSRSDRGGRVEWRRLGSGFLPDQTAALIRFRTRAPGARVRAPSVLAMDEKEHRTRTGSRERLS
jgi:hypothetical protein